MNRERKDEGNKKRNRKVREEEKGRGGERKGWGKEKGRENSYLVVVIYICNRNIMERGMRIIYEF